MNNSFLKFTLAIAVIIMTMIAYFIMPEDVAPDWAMEFFAQKRVVNAILGCCYMSLLSVAVLTLNKIADYFIFRK